MPNAERIEGRIENLSFIQEMLYEDLAYMVDEWWWNIQGSFNPGQVSIYSQNLEPTVSYWLEDAGYNWPWVDPSEYEWNLYESYDFDVTERAFSDSISGPVDAMWQKVDRAQMIQYAIEILEALL